MLRVGNTMRSLLVAVDDEKTKWTCLRRTSRLKDDALFQSFFIPQLDCKKGKRTKML